MPVIQQPIPSLVLSAVALLLGVYAYTRWQLRHIRPTAAPGSLLLLSGAFWILVNALEMASPDARTALFWNRMQFLAIAPLPLLWLYLALLFTGREHLLRPPRLLLLITVPLLCVVLALTNEFHALFITRLRVTVVNNIVNVNYDPGPFLVVLYVYGYLMILGGAYLLAQRWLRSPGFRAQGAMILLSVSLAVGANMLDWSGLNPFPQIRLTPIALCIAIPLFIITMTRARRADIVPIARSNILHMMQDAVLVLDIEKRIIDMNPAAEALMGQPLSAVIGQMVSSAWPAWGQQIDTLARRPAGGHELRIGTGEAARVFDVRRSDLDDSSGQRLCHVVVLRDMTDRVRAEAVLRTSEEYFRALTENATDIVVIISADGAISYASPSIERVFGFKLDAIIGQSAFDFIHPEDLGGIAAALAAAASAPGVAAPATARFRQQDGDWRLLECTANNMLDHPAVRGIVVNAHDISERAAAEAALRQSEERYRLHFAHINDVIYAFNHNYEVTSVSPSVERLLGHAPADLIGRPFWELTRLMPPAYYEKAAVEISRVLAGEQIEGALYEFIAKDGTLFTAEISANPLYQDGQIVGTINVARDISERVKMDAALRSSLAEKDILLKEIHHRVKNNLQIVASLLSLQSSAMKDPALLAQFRDSQSRIRSIALIHERLYRSHDLTHIPLDVYLRDLTTHLLQSYQRQPGQIRLTVDADAAQLDIDTAMGCGLLVNELMSNALKHAFPAERSGSLGVTLRHDGQGSYQLSVWDDGIGLPPGLDFYRTPSLGLQLVNNLAQQLGGQIEIHTGPGTRVTICFEKPLHPALSQEHGS